MMKMFKKVFLTTLYLTMMLSTSTLAMEKESKNFEITNSVSSLRKLCIYALDKRIRSEINQIDLSKPLDSNSFLFQIIGNQINDKILGSYLQKNFHSFLRKNISRRKLLIKTLKSSFIGNDDIISIRFGRTNDGQKVLLIGTYNKIISWNPVTGDIQMVKQRLTLKSRYTLLGTLDKGKKAVLSRDKKIIKIWNNDDCEEEILFGLLPNIAPVGTKLLSNKLLIISFFQLPPMGPARRIPEFVYLSEKEKLLANKENLLTNTVATIWDIDTKKIIGKLDRFKRSFERGIGVIEPFREKNIITASKNGIIEIWDLETGSCLSSFELKAKLGQYLSPTALKVLSDSGKEITVAVGYQKGIVRIWKFPLLNTMQIIFLIKFAQTKKKNKKKKNKKIILAEQWEKIYESLSDFLRENLV